MMRRLPLFGLLLLFPASEWGGLFAFRTDTTTFEHADGAKENALGTADGPAAFGLGKTSEAP